MQSITTASVPFTFDGPWQGVGVLTGFRVLLGATDWTGTRAARLNASGDRGLTA
jgi:hypothetical protein